MLASEIARPYYSAPSEGPLNGQQAQSWRWRPMPEQKLTVLVLWEGERAKVLRDHLCQRFRAQWKEQPDNSERRVEFTHVGELPEAADHTFFADVEHLMQEADLCVALQAHQDRGASEGGGNLWLEVGWWTARRGIANLFILSEQQAGTHVLPPSNLPGRYQRVTFEKLEDLNLGMTKWLQARFKELPVMPAATPNNPAVDKVRATLGDTVADWLANQVELCHRRHHHEGKACSCSDDALTFVAELLRMGRAARELADLTGMLGNISEHANEIATGSEKDSNAARFRLRRLRDLRKGIRDLESFCRTELQRPGRKEEEPWDRFKEFLEFRLNWLEGADVNALLRRLKPEELLLARFDAHHGGLSYSMDQFVTSALKFLQNEIDTDPLFRSGAGPSVTGLNTGDFLSFAYHAQDLARFLNQLRALWFVLTRRVMNDFFDEFNPAPADGPTDQVVRSLSGMFQAFTALSSDLPHNQPGDWPTIWPAAAAGQEGMVQ